jgi:GTP-binding protein YchF
MEVGITGLTGSGKSTLFRLLTGIEIDPGSSWRAEPKIGIAQVPDRRLDDLAGLYHPRKFTPATVRYLDMPGVREENQGEAGFQASQLRDADLLIVVLRAFEAPGVPHPKGSIDPHRDLANIEAEFLLDDQLIVERRVERIDKELLRTKSTVLKAEKELLESCLVSLEAGTPLREHVFSDEQQRQLRGFSFLTVKPLLIVVNVDETGIENDPAKAAEWQSCASRAETAVCSVCATLEAELAELEASDANELMAEYGLSEPALNRVIRSSYRLLGLISFFTVGEDECKAWSIRGGTDAVDAAGAIHSDIRRGFIRAEVVHFSDLLAAGSLANARAQGTLRLEGKDYSVSDGDVVHFRFNV